MKGRVWLGIVCIALALVSSMAGTIASNAAAPAASSEVVVIPVKGEISPALASFVRQELENAAAAGRDVILEIDTYGGYVDSAVQIKDAIFACDTNVSAYVNDKAISAGVLITIACNDVYMAPTASIGAAEVIPYSEKSLSAWVGILRGTAQDRGRDDEVIAAMADSRVVVEGISEEGALLTLTAQDSVNLGICDAQYKTLAALLYDMEAQAIQIDESLSVKAATVLTSTWLTSILFTVGILCLIAELFIPGFGVLGIIGVVCLGLYFFGGFLAGYAQWWSIILMVVGIGLLIAEMFIPGFGILGILGIVSIVAGLLFSSKSMLSFATVLVVAVVAFLLLLPVFFKLFSKSRLVKRIELDDQLNTESGYTPAETAAVELGSVATAATDLRPSGSVWHDGKRYDAISLGNFISKGTKVRVVQVNGQSLRVEDLRQDEE